MATIPGLSRECSLPGCSRVLEKRGWCGMHYRRWRLRDDPNSVLRVRHSGSPQERFWQKVDVGLCWEWLGTKLPTGYGHFVLDGRSQYVHRLVWEWLVGPIPRGFDIDHLCRNPCCVNPDHLEPVTRSVNTKRGIGPMLLNQRRQRT